MNFSFSWISATNFENFVSEDKFIDWLEVSSSPQKKEHPLSFLFQKGCEYEEKIVQILKNKNPTMKLEKQTSVKTSRDYIIKEQEYLRVIDFNKTIMCMKRGDKIIYSAYIDSKFENICGIPDLLIRNDHLSIMYPNLADEFSKSCNMRKYYYIPVEIKFSTVHLDGSDKYMANVERTKIYKTQLFTYCKILEEIQGIMPTCALVIGKKTINSSKEILDPLANPGFIDYSTKDNNIVKIFYDGLDWLRRVKTEGKTWELGPDFYPNMKIQNLFYAKEKQEAAEKTGEITEIFYCGMKNRKNAMESGITSWKDPNCTSDILEIREDQKTTVDMILKINRGELGNNYYPSRPIKDTNGWNVFVDEEMYVDFETVRNSLESDIDVSEETIFLIGVWFKGEYTSFLLEAIGLEEEKKILDDFYAFWIGNGSPKIWYWYAELGMWNRAQVRHPKIKNMNWADLYEVFYKEPFVIKGAKNFKLKSIAKALKNLGLIDIEVPADGECGDGLGALLTAFKYYYGHQSVLELDSVIRYNKLDCEYCYKLLKFLREL